MKFNLLWTGREYHSMEYCWVNTTINGWQIVSTIVGYYDKKIYKVDYSIATNHNWETISFEIESMVDNKNQLLSYRSDGKGNWTSKGKPVPQFYGCIDIDIPLTPLSNTLPINRLKLTENQTEEIQVIYIDLLEENIKPVRQKYMRSADLEYYYENVPNDFEAIIKVDEMGFVVDYPLLFVRTATLLKSEIVQLKDF